MTSERRAPELLSDDLDTLAAAMVIFAKVYRESIDPQLTDIYMAALGDLTVKDFKAAVDRLVKTQRFFPKPADIRQAVDELQRAAAARNHQGSGNIVGLPSVRTAGGFQNVKEGVARLLESLPRPK